MALPAIPPAPAQLLTPTIFQQKYQERFADNDFFDIGEADFREQARDVATLFLLWSKLGQPLLLSNLDELATVDQRTTVVGQSAMVANATDSGSAASGVEAGEAEFVLRKDSTGPLWAYVSVKSSVRVRVRWLPVGDPNARPEFLPVLQLEDYPYEAGDAVKHLFPNGQTIPLEVRRSLPRPGEGIMNPVPTGEEDDPNYLPLSPLVSSLPSGAGFSAAALAALMHPDSQVLLAEIAGQVSGSLLDGAVTLPKLEQSLQDAITQANYVFRNGAKVYLRGNAINEVVDGETVYIRKPLNIAQWVLKNATYIVDNVPLGADLITDNGVSVTARILGGSPLEARGRKARFTGPQSTITIEADLYLADNSTAVTVLNGAQVRHTGLLGGYGAGAVAVEIRGASKYYHVGESRFGGGYGIQAYDTAYVEMRETVPTSYGFYQALSIRNSAVIEYYGGLTLVPIDSAGNYGPHAYGFNAALYDNGLLRIKSGTFKNVTKENFYFDNGGRVEVSSGASVDGALAPAITGGAGVVGRHLGGQLLGTFGSATLQELPANTVAPTTPTTSGGGSTTDNIVIRSAGSTRVSQPIPILEPCQISRVVLRNNASGATFQIDTDTMGTVVHGDPDLNQAQASAVLQALTAAQRTAGVDMYVKTIATNAALDSRLIIQLA